MSRAKNSRQSKPAGSRDGSIGTGGAGEAPDQGRRKLLIAGVGGLGALAVGGYAGYRAGWFGKSTESKAVVSSIKPLPASPLPPVTLPANQENAIRAASDIVSHYTRVLKNPSTGIHALRGMGRRFTLDDGTNIVDFLSSRYGADKEVNGKRYIYFPREHEVHDNSFLKTMLEAGVSADQVFVAGSNRYTLRDVGESARALFRFDPEDIHRFDPLLPEEHLPWCLIAFSILVTPDNPTWTNAYGEKIDFDLLIDRGLADYETVCRKLITEETPAVGEPLAFRERVTKYSCFGMHAFYGFFSCYRHGFRKYNLETRMKEIKDHLITRLERDVQALAQETEAARSYGQQYIARMGVGADGKRRGEGPPPPEIIDVMSLNNFIITSGHALEALNYVRLHKLFPLSADQLKRIARQEAMLYEGLVKMRSYNLDSFLKWDPKFVNNLVISFSHALRAIKLLGPNNPDNVA